MKLPWHRRLEARVAMGASLLVGISLIAVLVAMNMVVRTNALTRATVDLQATRVAFYHLIDNRSESAATQLRLVTDLPIFRAHLTDVQLADDPDSLYVMVDGYRRSLAAEFVIVTNPRGIWTSSPGWPMGASAPSELTAAIDAAGKGRGRRSIIALEGRLFLIVSEPARFADEVLGTATAGFRLDDAVARELALTTRSDVNLLAGGHVSGSSLPLAQQLSLVDLIARDPNALGHLQGPADLRSVGDAQYVSGVYSMTSDGGITSPGALVLLQAWQPTQAFIDRVQLGVLRVGGILFLLAVGGGVFFSRRMTRPLSEMAAVTTEVAAGHWDRRVAVRGTSEVSGLAAAFNEMTASLSHWHAEAQTKTVQLQDSYERFFAVAQSAPDAVITTDEAGRVQFWNLSAQRIFGFSEGEMVNQPVEQLFDPVLRQTYRAGTERMRHGEPTSGVMEGTCRRKDGTELPVELSLATWRSSNRNNFTAIVRDTTERKRAEEALRHSENELRQSQKMEAIGRLAGGVAHDFNNLLTAIRGYAELLSDDLPREDARREDALQILKAAETAGSLTRQLLAFSRKQILAPKILNLDDIVRGMQKMLTRLIGEDIELTVTSQTDLWPVRADPGQIEQVVLNLALNARDAMPGGGRLSVALANVAGSAKSADHVVMTVTDTGTGMDADTLDHIFEPFFTTKAEGQGTGLGLAMVDGIIEQSGGRIEVESGPGRGTCFRIVLPRAEELVNPLEPSREQTEPAVFETVLLVEDEPGVRRFARQVLVREGYQVIDAACGEDALTEAGKHDGPIHLLLTDVVMPGMSGRRLWEELSAVREETKVLFVSGYTDDSVVRHGIGQSGLPYLQKPFSVMSLADAVRRALCAERMV